MTGRTHDLAAFTALNTVFVYAPIPHITLPTLLIAGFANLIGGLAPDIDNKSSRFWKEFRGGKAISWLVAPLFGGHRFISHSLVGGVIFSFVVAKILDWSSSFMLIDVNIIWHAAMIGFVSHLIADALTKEGIPLLYPINIKFGFPPFRSWRVKTGGIVEKSVVFPALIGLNIWLIYNFQPKYLELFQSLSITP